MAASLALPAAALASPLTTAEANAAPQTPAWATLSAEQLVRTEASLEPVTDPLALSSGFTPEALRARSAAFGLTGALDAIGDQGAASLREQLRSFLNVERGGAAPGHPGRPPNPSAGLAGIDPASAADEWVRDTVQALVNSTVRLETRAGGRAAFSVLGMGEFSVDVSGDRSTLTLAEGDDVLFVAQRPPQWGGAGLGARHPGLAGVSELGYVADDPAPVAPPRIKQLIEDFAEMATHPVSLLVYSIGAAYLLLWSVLSHQKRQTRGRGRAAPAAAAAAVDAPAPVRGKQRRRFRRRPRGADLPRTGLAATEAVAEAPAKIRKRVRMRIRVRVRKPAPSGRA